MKRPVSDNLKILMIMFGAFILFAGVITWYHLGTIEMVSDTVIQIDRAYPSQEEWIVRCQRETFELRRDLLISGPPPLYLIRQMTPGFSYLFKVNGKSSMIGYRNIIDVW